MTTISESSAWSAHAASLAKWAFRFLVNRTDVFGRYRYASLDSVAPGERFPVKQFTVTEELTIETVRRHFQASKATSLIGLHAVSLGDTCRWIEIDIDQHAERNDEVGQRNLLAARDWYSRLADLGFQPLLWHSNGRGGFRLNIRFSQPLLCREARSFGLWVVRDWQNYALPAPPEVFPKQSSIHDTEKKLGSWVRLPGRHHKRAWYPEVFDGSGWLRGEAAVQHILGLDAQATLHIPAEALEFALPTVKMANRSGTAFFVPDVVNEETVRERAAAILSSWKLPEAGDRNATLFRAGCTIGERLPVSQADHRFALAEFNQRFRDPLSDSEVSSVARSSFERTKSRRGQIAYSPQVVEEIAPVDSGDAVSLETYRELLATQYATLVGNPGLYLDRTPVGVGKTHQGAICAGNCQTSLHVIPTHRTKDDLVQLLVNIGGIPEENVAAFPERTTENCQKMLEVTQQYKFGIVVPSALCSTCEYRTGCPHLAERQRAETAPHTVATMARLENDSFARVGANRELIRIDEDSLNLLRPKVKAPIKDLQRFLVAVESAIQIAGNATDADFTACIPFLKQLKTTGSALLTTAETATADTSVPIDTRLESPKLLEFLLKRGFERSGIEPQKGDHLAEAKKALVGLVTGRSKRCVIQVTDDGKGIQHKALVAVWQTELPCAADGTFSAPILLSDATADAQLLQLVLGTEVTDITPAATVRRQQRVVQVPMDVKRSTTAESFNKILRGLLVAFPEKRRIGVIGHRPHIQAIDELGPTFRQRIIKTTYFGSGQDRASNEWLEEELDLLVVIGTPRIAPVDIRTRMIQLDLDTNTPPTAKWKNRYWRGRTETGAAIDIVTRRYDDASWQRAYEYDLRATLIQALGRARSILPHGMDAVVVTCEPLKLPIWNESLVEVSETVEKAIDFLMTTGVPSDLQLWSVLSSQLGLAERTAKQLVGELTSFGIIRKKKKGRYVVAPSWKLSSSVATIATSTPNAATHS